MRKRSISTAHFLPRPGSDGLTFAMAPHLLLKFLIVSIMIGLLLFTGMVLLAFLVIKMGSSRFLYTIDAVPPAHTAIVLGAAIMKDGTPTQIFKDRIDTAAALYRDGKVKSILITGDDGSRTHNEVNPARDYLLSLGVPSEAIFLDHAGFDTYSSMYRAKEVFYVGSAIICTQSFHLPRAVFIARRLGLDVYGVASDQHGYFLRNNFRELLADVKAVFNLITMREPKYLGEPIPITGDSSKSI